MRCQSGSIFSELRILCLRLKFISSQGLSILKNIKKRAILISKKSIKKYGTSLAGLLFRYADNFINIESS